MADREAIAKRHGIPHLAHKLVGETSAELEADAAAKAAIIQMFTPRRLDEEPPEPPAEPSAPELDDEQVELVRRYNLPAELVTRVRGATWLEKCADAEEMVKLLPESQSIKERARRHLHEQLGAEANRTPDQQDADEITAALQPGAKEARNRALIRSLYPEEGGE